MLLHIRDDDAFDRRPDCGLSDLWIETREDNDDARARIGELVVELADRVERIGRNNDGACLEASEERVDELRAVGKDKGDPVALADAEPLEAGGEPVGEVVDIPVRHRRVDTAAADGTTKPYLAQSITPNSDYTKWTITMRPNIVFHNGTPLDANAVKINLDLHSRPGCRTLLAMPLNSHAHFVITGLGRCNKRNFVAARGKLLSVPALPTPGAAQHQRD